MSGESVPKKTEKKRPSKLETTFGRITQDGDSLVVRMSKGLQKAKKLGLPLKEDVFVIGVSNVGAVITTAPLVVTGTNLIQVLDRIKEEIDILRQNLEAEQGKVTYMLQDYMWKIAHDRTKGIVRPLHPRKQKKKKMKDSKR